MVIESLAYTNLPWIFIAVAIAALIVGGTAVVPPGVRAVRGLAIPVSHVGVEPGFRHAPNPVDGESNNWSESY